jgi:large subunit ribosomal protein L1
MAEAKKTAKTKTKAVEPKEKQTKHAEVVAETVPAGQAPEVILEVEAEPSKATAKSGKRSAKAAKESEEQQAKAERKAEAVSDKPKAPVARVTKTKAERAGKKYRESLKLIDKTKDYPLAEALELAAKASPVKFDASIELHINLGVDPRQADQNVRDTVALPAGTGKSVKIAVLADASEAAKAKAAGADSAGEDEIFAKLDKEELDFDILIATPAMMPRLGKYARLLGPRGLMPNPKSGTVAADTAEAVNQAKAGRVEYRVDQAGIIHLSVGKASFGKDKLNQNAEAVMASVRAAKPASLKGIYIKSIYVSSTMGPSVKVTV